MLRVVILGNSGSGKSTLAHALARESSLPHLDLDTLAWDPVNPTTRRRLDESLAGIAAFVDAHQSWVVEGCYADLLASAAEHCTRLIFLNPGIEACVDNCLSRPWEPHKYPSLEAQNGNLEMLLSWVRDCETRQDEFSLQAHRRLFGDFGGDKVEFTSRPTIREL